MEVRIANKHIQNSLQALDVKPRELVQVAQIRLRKLNGKKRVEPSGIAVSSNGEIAVVDKLNGRVFMYSKDGKFLRDFGHRDSGNGELNGPCGAAFIADGELLIGDELNHRVQVFDCKTGEFFRC